MDRFCWSGLGRRGPFAARSGGSSPLPIAVALLILWLGDTGFHLGVRDLETGPGIAVGLVEASLATAILWISVRLDLTATTLVFLAVPYALFFPGWMSAAPATLFFGVTLWCTVLAIRWRPSMPTSAVTSMDFMAFAIVLAWVHLSGAGGYGYQSSDYAMHNARLHDLVTRPWPVRYGANQNLVYYIGYFLPSAGLGKWAGMDIAQRSLFFWTALGVTLALRWLARLSRLRFSPALVLLFALFGPLDIFNVAFQSFYAGNPVDHAFMGLANETDSLDFATWRPLGFFLGNYLSNTFGLFWSPQQVVAGWLGMAMLTHLHEAKEPRFLLFGFSLLCLWAPLAMLAMFPMVLLATASALGNQGRFFTLANILGTPALLLPFGLFYLGGSAGTNPSFWLWSVMSGTEQWPILLAFVLFGWGAYAFVVTALTWRARLVDPPWLCGLALCLALLPVWTFGEWADLLCRGSSPLMFLLFLLILRGLRSSWDSGRRAVAVLTLFLLVPGFGSAVLHLRLALVRYGLTQPMKSVIEYNNAYPNLGPDDSLFERLFQGTRPSTADRPTANPDSP